VVLLFQVAQCATVALPLDYDAPKGPKVEVAVLRVKARKPAQKIGSLFVNPGGPGGSGVSAALSGPAFLSDTMLDRFDIVGFDPRGMGYSQKRALLPQQRRTGQRPGPDTGLPFPVTTQEQKGHIAAARTLGRACSTTGKPLSGRCRRPRSSVTWRCCGGPWGTRS
jgi:pimeloyl-ACP methyl ester carboxylesterase